MGERVLIDGHWYTVDTGSLLVTVTGRTSAYATFEAYDETAGEQVILEYVSMNRSVPIPEQPHRIIRPDKEGSE